MILNVTTNLLKGHSWFCVLRHIKNLKWYEGGV